MFWRENRVWPFLHYLVPLAFYVCTRHLFLSLWIIYVWESFEVLYAHFVNPAYAEPWYDRLIGDPLQGSLAIGTAALADAVFGWGQDFSDQVSGVARLTFFVLVFVAQITFNIRTESVAIVIYGSLYASFAALLLLSQTSGGAQTSVVALIVVVILQTLVVAPDADESRYTESRFSRSFVLGLVILLVLLVVMLTIF